MGENIEKLVKIESMDQLRELETGREIYINIKNGERKNNFIGGKFMFIAGKYLSLSNYSKIPMSLNFSDYTDPKVLDYFRKIKEFVPAKSLPEDFEMEFPLNKNLEVYAVDRILNNFKIYKVI